MMKKIMILCIRFYRSAISPHMRPCCRYTPTCSAYALEAIEKYGAWKGGWLAVKRILRCHPFSHHNPYDRSMAKNENSEQLQEEKPLEEMFTELDLLAGKLEDRETSLEDSFRLYRQGMELLKLCSEKLDTVEKKMLQLNEDGTFSEFSR